jgi:hypothetical protein
LAVFLLLTILVVGCRQDVLSPPPSTSPSVAEIRETPADYEGNLVIIEGEYMGWKGGFGSPPVTRSDWVLQDVTGGLYVTGKPAGLDPVADIGRAVRVTGIVRITDDGVPCLCAQEVEINAGKASARLIMQIGLREQQLADPLPERLEQMETMGMRTDDLRIQRIYIHLAQPPTAQQMAELEGLGVITYPGSWIPADGEHPTGFMTADMPIDKLEELAGKDYVILLDTAEQAVAPAAGQ